MRVEGELQNFSEQDWIRAVANVLQTEVEYIQILWLGQGSVIVDFIIEDPDLEDLDDEDSSIRKLSGNEKMLLLYEWWVTNNSMMEDFPYDIINFDLFSRKSNSNDVVELFAPTGEDPSLIYPTLPDGDEPSRSGFYFEQTTLAIDVTIGGGDRLDGTLSLFITLAAFFICLLI